LTDFIQELRTYCRNTHCRSKLKTPVSNPREAFCAKGCHGAFYLKRCRVCDGAIEQGRGRRRLICRKAKCRSAFRANSGMGRYHVAGLQKTPSETIDFIDSKQPLRSGRGWFIVAGPELTPDQLHCATIPDGPNGRWEDGFHQRVEAQNKDLLREHFRVARVKPANTIIGAVVSRWEPCSPASPIMDDLSIPAFLKRAA
jgi:hypothetical protein